MSQAPQPKSNHNCVFSPVSLPCGRVLQNRLVKVAMYEHLASLFGGPPNSLHESLYRRWSQHNWGMLVTGNVQVSPQHLSLGRDMVIPQSVTEQTLESFRRLAAAMQGNANGSTSASSLAIMQLSHGGRQSPNILGGRLPFAPPLAPSSIRVGSRSKNSSLIADVLHWLLFQTPKPMTLDDIDDVVHAFVKGAQVASKTGFDGVQLHVAHGYLLASFLSRKTNLRSDMYSFATALELVRRIAFEIRAVVRKDFVLGIKINASDYVDSVNDCTTGAEAEMRALEQICIIAGWGAIDFIEISGGDYENPAFMDLKSSISPRQALFASFSRNAIQVLESIAQESHSKSHMPLILLTGGFRSPSQLYTALDSRHADLLGIGRYSVLCPSLPSILWRRQDELSDLDQDFSPRPAVENPSPRQTVLEGIWQLLPKIRLVGAGISIAWYIVAIRKLATHPLQIGGDTLQLNLQMGYLETLLNMWLWVNCTTSDRQQHAPRMWNISVTLIILFLVYGLVTFGPIES